MLALLICLPLQAGAADALKISQLEQDVRELQRQVQAQSRQLDELRALLSRAREGQVMVPRESPESSAATAREDRWLDIARWQQLRTGMQELAVMDLLGPPTSMRNENDARVLLYALEIGATGFLAGSVTLRDRVVVAVQNPALH